MVDLADMVVLGDGIRRRFLQPAAMDHADADVRLADVYIPDLLIDQFLRDGLLGIIFKFGCWNIGAGAHGAGRLRVGGVDPQLFLSGRRRRC